nr:MAG TPA: hypothetical protein [Caudoviricetes sp.]
MSVFPFSIRRKPSKKVLDFFVSFCYNKDTK